MVRRRPAHLIVFARVPRLGEVKTRLAAAVGASAALEAHRMLLVRTLETGARCSAFESRSLAIAGHDVEGECMRLADRWGYGLASQRGGDLGARMAGAIDAACEGGALAVLVGSDCPELSADDLDQAVNALEGNDVVIAPAEDGGYVLIGCANPGLPIFEGVAWGSARVFEQTLLCAERAGLRVARLRTLWDVDEASDWKRWRGR